MRKQYKNYNVVFVLLLFTLFTSLNYADNKQKSITSSSIEKKDSLQLENQNNNTYNKNEVDKIKNEILEKFEIQKENLDFKNQLVNWIIAFLGILLTVLAIIIPFFGYRLKNEIENKKKEASNSIMLLQNDVKEKLNFYVEEAKKYLDDMSQHKETAKKYVQSLFIEAAQPNLSEKQKEIIVFNAEKVVEKPNSTDLQKDLANSLSLYLSDKIEEAKIAFTNIIQHHEKELDIETLTLVYFNYAYCLDVLEEFSNAKQYYEKAIALKPDYHKAWNNLAIIYEKENDFNKAKTFYKNAILYNPIDISYWENLGNLYGRKNKNHKAIKCYKRGLKIEPNSTSLQLNIIESRIYLNEIEIAKLELENIKKNPEANKFAVLLFDIYFLTLDNKWNKSVTESLNILKNSIDNNKDLINWNFDDTIDWLKSSESVHLNKKQKAFFNNLIIKINDWINEK